MCFGGGGGGGSGSGTQVTYIRYAPYIESSHKVFLGQIQTYRNAKKGRSPYAAYTATNIDTAFLGAGILISAYGSLFGKFLTYMQNIDTASLYDTAFTRTVNSQNVKNLVTAEGALLSEEIENEAYPRMLAGARDLNAVMSSTFVIGKANIEATRLKLLSKFSTGLKFSLLPHAMAVWKTQLEWNRGIVDNYARYLQLYYSAKMDTIEQNYTMAAKDELWPFTILDHERAALGAMQGAMNTKSIAGEGPSTGQKVIGGAMSGAAAGAMIAGTGAGPMGALLGGAIGGLAGLLF